MSLRCHRSGWCVCIKKCRRLTFRRGCLLLRIQRRKRPMMLQQFLDKVPPETLREISEHAQEQRGIELPVHRTSCINRKFFTLLLRPGISNHSIYRQTLKDKPKEADDVTDAFPVKPSRSLRNQFVFAVLRELLPERMPRMKILRNKGARS